MFMVLTALIAMLCTMVVMMFLKERETNEHRRKNFVCATTTEHGLRIHSYDRNGEVYHRCRCGARIDYTDASGWCNICADPRIEREARYAFFRKTA